MAFLGSEIGSGFGEPGGTPLPKIPRSTPPPAPGAVCTGFFNRSQLQVTMVIMVHKQGKQGLLAQIPYQKLTQVLAYRAC